MTASQLAASHVLLDIDQAAQPGQFLLTGSAVPAEDASRHTGAGRFAFLRMRPMSLFETGASSGAVSLEQLFAGDVPAVADPGLNIHDLSARLPRAGEPGGRRRCQLEALLRADRLTTHRLTGISCCDLWQRLWLPPLRWGRCGSGWGPWALGPRQLTPSPAVW